MPDGFSAQMTYKRRWFNRRLAVRNCLRKLPFEMRFLCSRVIALDQLSKVAQEPSAVDTLSNWWSRQTLPEALSAAVLAVPSALSPQLTTSHQSSGTPPGPGNTGIQSGMSRKRSHIDQPMQDTTVSIAKKPCRIRRPVGKLERDGTYRRAPCRPWVRDMTDEEQVLFHRLQSAMSSLIYSETMLLTFLKPCRI